MPLGQYKVRILPWVGQGRQGYPRILHQQQILHRDQHGRSQSASGRQEGQPNIDLLVQEGQPNNYIYIYIIILFDHLYIYLYVS